MRLRFICGGLLALTMLSSTELNAQEDRHAAAHNDSSDLFHTQYNVVGDHPDCNAPGHVAFTVSLQRNFIEQFIFDPVDQSSVLISHELLTPSTETANELSSGHTIIQKLAVETPVEEVCTTRIGRGGEVIEIQIRCPDEPAEKITQAELEATWIARLASATLSTEGTVTICTSPTKVEILEVTGHVNATYTQTNEGTSALPGDTQALGVEIHNSSPFDEMGVLTTFFHLNGAESPLEDRNEPDISGIEVDEIEHSDHYSLDHGYLVGSFVRLEARCVPVEGLHETTLFMSFSAKLGITDESFESCFTSDCPELVMLRDSEIHHHERSLDSCTIDP